MDTVRPESLRHDARVIGVVSFAHLASHFFQLALPPLFPLLRAEFGASYAVLGTLVGVYYAASGITQFVRGALTGARKVGARIIFVTCWPGADLQNFVDLIIAPAAATARTASAAPAPRAARTGSRWC